MKYVPLILFALLSMSCNQNSKRDQDPAKDPDPVANFDWLLGSWLRTNDQEGNLTYEHWTKNSSTEYSGLGCTLHKGDTVFKEYLRLFKTEEYWNFEVVGVNEHPTNFPVIRQTENSFICENRNNEFPKIIHYALRDSILTARISDDETGISFLFERIQMK